MIRMRRKREPTSIWPQRYGGGEDDDLAAFLASSTNRAMTSAGSLSTRPRSPGLFPKDRAEISDENVKLRGVDRYDRNPARRSGGAGPADEASAR